MKITNILPPTVTILCLFSGFTTAQEVMNMRSIQEMCGPKWGIRSFIDRTECVMRVLPQSNNPDLIPTDPYIGSYTQMAWKMIDDVRNKRISEDDARYNVQQAYHDVLIRQAQAARDQDNQEAMERQQVRLAQEEKSAEAQAVYAAETQTASDAERVRDREKIRRALSSLSDNLNSIADAKQKQAESLGRSADEIGRRSSQYEAERAAQRVQQQIADEQARQIPVQRPPATLRAPVRADPLVPAPAPSQTAESRRAAGLPDDPAAAACIQDDDCARALRSKN